MTHVCLQMIQQLEGRFQFMWGLYRAHSLSEDEIVFPALEVQRVLRAYLLDCLFCEAVLQITVGE